MSENSVPAALERFVRRQRELQPEPPMAIYDPEWMSVCYQVDPTQKPQPNSQIPWVPVRQEEAQTMFQRLGEALEVAVHPDIVAFYSQYWSDPLPARSSDGELSLLQVWNDDDMERLRSNLIGHALVLRKQKRPLTFFFACTEPDGNYFLSIENETGVVLLEQPGKKPLRKLADSLADYLDTLEPLKIPDME